MNNQKYKVLKEFEGLEVGAIVAVNVFADLSSDEIDNLIADGTIEIVSETVDEKYIVTQEHLDNNLYFASLGIPVGTEVQYDPSVVISREEAINQGIDVEAIEAEDLKEKENSGANVDDIETAIPTKDKIYMGKKVVSEREHDVNGKSYVEIRLEDGSTSDLTHEQYKSDITEVEVQ